VSLRIPRIAGYLLGIITALGLATSTASAGPVATPGYYSLTVYDSNYNIVAQAEVPVGSINNSSIYDLDPTTSVTIGSTSYLLWNISIFASGALEFPNANPTAIYAAGGNPVTGPWDAIFGLTYDANTQTWNGNSINYFLGFSAGPPGTGTPNAPDGASTYDAENSITTPWGYGFFSATQYLATDLTTPVSQNGFGYTAYFYDPFATPEPASLTLLGTGFVMLAGFARFRRRNKLRATVA
jgi:hypothetical protein